MLTTTTPDSLRPDHSAASFIPAGAFPTEDDAIARKMATVILRQASDGQPTELRHFREADETKALTPDQIALNIGLARAIADRRVIRQDDPAYHVPSVGTGSPERLDDRGASRAPIGQSGGAAEMADQSTDELLVTALPLVAQLVTSERVSLTLIRAGLSVAQIRRIWPTLTVRAAAALAATPAPSISELLIQARAI
jgi:hypothetical protein